MADAAPITRRALVVAGGAALGAAALPAGITRALALETLPVAFAGAAPPMFDAAAFVADVRGAGFEIVPTWEPPGPGWEAGRPAYSIGPGARGTFGGRPWLGIMQRWGDAIEACPDHTARVVAHLAQASP